MQFLTCPLFFRPPGGDTGSVSPTKSGVYAFWPIMGGPGKGAIGSAVASDKTLTTWNQRGPTIPMPKRINTGYRDPVRAFEWNDKWYVGVGCGNKEEGAQFCLFEAEDRGRSGGAGSIVASGNPGL